MIQFGFADDDNRTLLIHFFGEWDDDLPDRPLTVFGLPPLPSF